MDLLQEITGHIESHYVEGIRHCFNKGITPNDSYEGKSLFDIMLSMYTRSSRFKACVKLFIENGFEHDSPELQAILTDDVEELQKIVSEQPNIINQKYDLPCAYTPMSGVSLLHICAEYNHIACAKILIEAGADINAKAAIDEYGFGGQTPIFHTVNQNHHRSEAMLDLLIDHDADLEYTVRGIIWGQGFPWETLIPSTNPINYAMFGMLPQMHRDESIISQVVSKLLKKAYNIDYNAKNIPNQYLKV